jgi:hypothetical protein
MKEISSLVDVFCAGREQSKSDRFIFLRKTAKSLMDFNAWTEYFSSLVRNMNMNTHTII